MATADPNEEPEIRAPRKFTSGDALMLVAVAGMLAAVVYPAYRKYHVSSIDRAVQENLARLAAAADQYFLEHSATVVQVRELVGPSAPLKALQPVANETYPAVLVMGDALVAKGVEGIRSVSLLGASQLPGQGAGQLITPMSATDLTRVVDMARKRTVEVLSPIAPSDLARMPSSYEWGSGQSQRMWRRVSPTMWNEVYPDGRYSQFPVLGHATVNGTPGVIAAKDDGSFEVFIPDKGGRMVHQIGSGGIWSDYMQMEKVQ